MKRMLTLLMAVILAVGIVAGGAVAEGAKSKIVFCVNIQPQLPVAPGGNAKQVQLQGLTGVGQAADGDADGSQGKHPRVIALRE